MNESESDKTELRMRIACARQIQMQLIECWVLFFISRFSRRNSISGWTCICFDLLKFSWKRSSASDLLCCLLTAWAEVRSSVVRFACCFTPCSSPTEHCFEHSSSSIAHWLFLFIFHEYKSSAIHFCWKLKWISVRSSAIIELSAMPITFAFSHAIFLSIFPC